MSPDRGDYEVLVGVERAADVPRVERILDRAGIPYQTGVIAKPQGVVVFLVPQPRLAEAQALLERKKGPRIGKKDGPARFPWGPVQVVAGLVLAHLAIVFTLVGPSPTAADLERAGGLVSGSTWSEPWRLLTSLFVHSGPPHVLWNAVSMLVFTVPLVATIGYARTAGVYLGAGLCGGLAALSVTAPGVVIVGSSGAVAGLFGAWLSLNLVRAWRQSLTRRALVRVAGVGLLVLPSFLSPTTSAGRAVSVESHLGGLLFGIVAGLVLALGFVPREPEEQEDDALEEGPGG